TTQTINDFLILTNEIGDNIPNQLPAAVSAASAKYGVDIRAFQHLQELTEPPLACSGKVTVCGRDVGTIVGFESEALELPATLVQQILFDVTCRSDDADRMTRSKCSRLDEFHFINGCALTVAAVYEDVNQLESSVFPSLR